MMMKQMKSMMILCIRVNYAYQRSNKDYAVEGDVTCMYVCMYVCVHVCMFTCMYCTYVCMYVCKYVYMYVRMHVFMYVCINECMYIRKIESMILAY